MRLKRLTMVRLAYFACAKVSAGVWAARILHCVCWYLRRVLVSDCAFAGCAYVFVPTPLVAWQLLLSTGACLPGVGMRRDSILTSLLVVCRLTFRRVDNDEATRSDRRSDRRSLSRSFVCQRHFFRLHVQGNIAPALRAPRSFFANPKTLCFGTLCFYMPIRCRCHQKVEFLLVPLSTVISLLNLASTCRLPHAKKVLYANTPLPLCVRCAAVSVLFSDFSTLCYWRDTLN